MDEGLLIAIIVLSSLAGLALIVVGAICAYKEIKRRQLYDKSGVARQTKVQIMPADYVAPRSNDSQTEMANHGPKTAKTQHLQNTQAAIMPTRDDTDENSSYGGPMNNNDFSSNSALQ